ncbi:hypothetical protein ACLESD_13135, partial [Pyxidicoccus sp. 3LFB2]
MLRTLLGLTLALALGCATQEESAPTAPASVKTEVPPRPEVGPLKEKVSTLTTRLRREASRREGDVTPLLTERARALAALLDED